MSRKFKLAYYCLIVFFAAVFAYQMYLLVETFRGPKAPEVMVLEED